MTWHKKSLCHTDGQQPRFIELPRVGEYFYLMYMEDIIKANIDRMFPGYELDCSYCCKISRDADIFVDDAESYSTNEVAIYWNSPLVALISAVEKAN